jgi:hypothetical protein
MTYPAHPAIRVTPYPGGADIIPLQASAGWTAAIRGEKLRAFDATRQIAVADPWWSLTEGPALLVEWCRMGALTSFPT